MTFYSKISDGTILNNFILDRNQVKNYLNSIYPSILNNKLFHAFISHKFLEKRKVLYKKKYYWYKKDIDQLIKKWLSPMVYKFNLQPIYDNSYEHNINTHYSSKAQNYKNNSLDNILEEAGIASKNLKKTMEIPYVKAD